ncbi:hypothetical protein [Motilibacter aurantiacus]|uniref:hypothetical protein n=1 Tax=Motilibacter aurantiacus TaxID=2714955 RepID=UPI00140A74D5|nr:hypothetical protein [Motilibacter aurantiacus]NHC46951.1 hypothetical protein [Motilibacter aurantiacus]
MDELPPPLAGALHHLRLLDPRDRPMQAAHWLAQGLDSPCLRELAGLRGPEAEVDGLWHRALAELGAHVPPPAPHFTAAPWAARRVLAGTEDVDWLLRVLWLDPFEPAPEEEARLGRVVYALEQHISSWSWTKDMCRRPRLLGRARARAELATAEAELRRVPDVLRALAEADLDAAEAAIDPAACRR